MRKTALESVIFPKVRTYFWRRSTEVQFVNHWITKPNSSLFFGI